MRGKVSLFNSGFIRHPERELSILPTLHVERSPNLNIPTPHFCRTKSGEMRLFAGAH